MRTSMKRPSNWSAKAANSFGSSVTPLLAEGYKTVTLIDIREIPSPNLKVLAKYIGLDFTGKDVLMLYSTSVLNAGNELK